ncbi:MAG TPA: CopG family transcriptional regulator [Candidatus Cloacimonetes bacterium]|nr:CopG family transcriptional regulator [Candidatus Cloacimonadota bacterium]
MTTQMIIRIESELKNKVSLLAQSEGKKLSSLVRELLESYVKERDISAYIDDLWNRIGDNLKYKKITQDDIKTAIRKVRAEK